MQILPYLFRATTLLADVLRLLAHIAHFHTQWYLGPAHKGCHTGSELFSPLCSRVFHYCCFFEFLCVQPVTLHGIYFLITFVLLFAHPHGKGEAVDWEWENYS